MHMRANSKTWATVALQDDPLMKTFEHNMVLLFPRPTTRRCYLSSLTSMPQLCEGRPIRDLIIPSPVPMLNTLMHAAHYHNIKANTIKNMLTALLCLMSNVLSDRSQAKPEVLQALALLRNAHKQAKKAAKARATASNWVTHGELCQARDSLPQRSQARLFMHVVTSWPNINYLHDCALTYVERAAPNAQLVLPHTRGGSAVVIYPIKPGADHPQRVSLSSELTTMINASLEHEPWQHLFAFRVKAGYRPYKPQAFLKWGGKVLKNATGDPTATLTKACKVIAAHHLAKGGNMQTMASALGRPVQSVRTQCRQTLLLLKHKDEHLRLKSLQKNSTMS